MRDRMKPRQKLFLVIIVECKTRSGHGIYWKSRLPKSRIVQEPQPISNTSRLKLNFKVRLGTLVQSIMRNVTQHSYPPASPVTRQVPNLPRGACTAPSHNAMGGAHASPHRPAANARTSEDGGPGTT